MALKTAPPDLPLSLIYVDERKALAKNHRAGRDRGALRLQMHVHRIQHHPAEIVLFEHVTEAQEPVTCTVTQLPRAVARKHRPCQVDAEDQLPMFIGTSEGGAQ